MIQDRKVKCLPIATMSMANTGLEFVIMIHVCGAGSKCCDEMKGNTLTGVPTNRVISSFQLP